MTPAILTASPVPTLKERLRSLTLKVHKNDYLTDAEIRWLVRQGFDFTKFPLYRIETVASQLRDIRDYTKMLDRNLPNSIGVVSAADPRSSMPDRFTGRSWEAGIAGMGTYSSDTEIESSFEESDGYNFDTD